jgi:hypothetical protein
MSVWAQTKLFPGVRLRLVGPDALAVISLFAMGGLVYGLFVGKLGYYWDDWPVVWVYNALGREGVTKYFAGLRPVYGWLYASFAPILGRSPVGWHVLALVIRCASCATLYFAFCALWPRRKEAAWLVGTLVLLYPGFTLQPVAFSLFQYHMSFLFFAVSLATTILSFTKPAYRWTFCFISLITGAFSYLIIEYFLGLELFRLMLIVILTRREYASWNLKRLRTALLRWCPYATVWVAYFVWRSFLFRVASNYSQTGYMDVSSDLSPILRNPLYEILSRGLIGVHNILMSTVFSLVRPLNPDVITINSRAGVLSLTIAAVVMGIGIYTLRRLTITQEPVPAEEPADDKRRFLEEGLLLGLTGGVVAELPFLASNLGVAFTEHPSFQDRWTLPFMLPASLMLSCLLACLQRRGLSRTLLVSSILFAFSAFQIQNERAYRQDWLAQKALFWQLAWRAPVLKQGTSILVEGMPLSLYGNHTAGTLNLLYNRDDRGGRLDYFIFDLTGVPWARPNLTYRPGDRIVGRVRWFSFEGTTTQSLVSWISPSGTLRIVAQPYAEEDLRCSAVCQNISYLSHPGEVISDAPGRPGGPLLDIFGSEPVHDWPYFYEKSELQRQLKHWDMVAMLGDQVTKRGYKPSDPSEWLPFIEGYARSHRYQTAIDLSNSVLQESPNAMAALSSLWLRVKSEDSPSPELDSALSALRGKLWLQNGQ